MESDALLQLLLLFALGVLGTWFLINKQRAKSAETVQQLQPSKEKLDPKDWQDYSREEVAKHNTDTDVWIILKDRKTGENRVYDITGSVDDHPGGPAILRNAGGDASEGFFDSQHTPTVFEIVEEYCIGRLID
jgi:cytochrome b involved in lipid metabolism